MKVLVGCEYSGRVRDAFRRHGIPAWSCDIRPSDSSQYHIQDDILNVIHDDWDMLIAFPPCTYLTNAGNGWLSDLNRTRKRHEAIQFVFDLFYNNDIPRKAIENPSGVLSTVMRKPDQVIHPYMFGHPYTKRTCIWVDGLPPLKPTNIVQPVGAWVAAQKGQKEHSPRKRDREVTFAGIANAMAEQWSPILLGRNDDGYQGP